MPETLPGRVRFGATLRSRWRTLCDERGDERGDSLVELALVLSILGVPLLLGTVQIATIVNSSIEISSAANAAAMYGMTSPTYASDNSGMTTAAQQEAADFGTRLTVTPSTFFACSSAINGTRYATQSAASTACTGSGNHALQFVQVIASVPIATTIHWPGLARSFTVSSTAVMEVEE